MAWLLTGFFASSYWHFTPLIKYRKDGVLLEGTLGRYPTLIEGQLIQAF